MILLSFLPLFSNGIVKADHDFSSSHVLSFNQPIFSTIMLQNTSFVRVTINDCMMTSNPGTAELPFYSTHILIPDGCSIHDITVTPTDSIDYSELVQTQQIIPNQEETPFSSQKTVESLQMNHSWYQQNSFFPSDLVSLHGISYMKGYPVETIHVYPLQYNPLIHQLRFYEELEITITFSNDDSPMDESSNQFFRKKDNDADAVKDLVLNPDLVDSYSTEEEEEADDVSILGSSEPIAHLDDAYAGGLCNSSEDVDYVIVTSEELSLATGQSYSWSDLLSHRFQIDGFSGLIVTMEEILGCSDYYSDTAVFNDSAARLREFCKDAYLDWNTEYILLGGSWETGNADRQIVPCRIVKDCHEDYPVKTMPSDLYFSNLDGDWYYETESVFGGGPGAANDKLSELAVGRIPVWNAEMVSNAVQKIIWYDTCDDENFLRSAGFLGGDLRWTSTSKQYMEEIRRGDGEWSEYTGFEEWNNDFSTYEIDTSGRYYDADYASESDAIQACKNAINNNELCLISHLDHGSETNTLSLGDGSSLSNSHYFLGTSQACLSGRFTSCESGASTFLSSWDDRGAFAMVLNTGYGYGSSSSTRGKSQLQHKIFWDYFFENQTTDFDNWRLGKAMQYTKDTFSSTIDVYHVYTYVWYSWNLFGDPAQQIRLTPMENIPPVIESINPVDNQVDVLMNLTTISITVTDEDNDLLNWSIETSPTVGSASGISDTSGQKNCTVSNLDYFTEYTVFVNVSDGSFWLTDTYSFTTGPDLTNNVPVISQPSPGNQTNNVDVWNDTFSVQINDSNGDMCNLSIEGTFLLDKCYETLTNETVNTSSLAPLPFNTTFSWFVNVTDHRSYPVNYCFTFTTRESFTPLPPSNLCVEPVNRTAVQLDWAENTSSDATVIERNNVSTWNRGEGTLVYNGTDSTLTDTGLFPGTAYYYQAWSWNHTDFVHSQIFSSNNTCTLPNNPVSFSSIAPSNNSINHSLNLTWSVDIADEDGDEFNWTIHCNNTDFNQSTMDSNGTKSVNLTNLSYYTNYIIWVNATDGCNTTNQSFSFRTKLPNDTQKPEITSITLINTKDEASDTSDWSELQCSVTDNFRMNTVFLNITQNETTSQNRSLTFNDEQETWIISLEDELTNQMNLTLYATDLNGNMNSTTLSLISVESMLGSQFQNLDYLDISKELSTVTFTVNQSLNQTLTYTFTSSPTISSFSGSLTGNETLGMDLSTLSYATSYECQLTLTMNQSGNQSFIPLYFVSTLLFTSESAPESPSQETTPPSSGGMPPMPAVEPEEEANLPPERPLPPQGSLHLNQYELSNFTVSSWDQNDDFIRFQIDWDNGSMSSWSTFVSSNETVTFSKSFTEVKEYEIRVRAQDESGMNSSWSEVFTVSVTNEQERETEENTENDGIVATVNNQTGETQFTIENDESDLQDKTIVWDFGDGTIFEGSSPKHQYTKPGTYTVKVTVTDEQGNTSMKTYIVTIPEPEQKINTSELDLKEKTNGSVSWILILVGMICSIVAVFVVMRFR